MYIEKAFTHTHTLINVSCEIHAYAYVCVQVYTSNWETLCLVFQTMTGSKLCLVKTLNSLYFSLSVCSCVSPLCTLYFNLCMPHTHTHSCAYRQYCQPSPRSRLHLSLSLFTSPVRFGLYHHRTQKQKPRAFLFAQYRERERVRSGYHLLNSHISQYL